MGESSQSVSLPNKGQMNKQTARQERGTDWQTNRQACTQRGRQSCRQEDSVMWSGRVNTPEVTDLRRAAFFSILSRTSLFTSESCVCLLLSLVLSDTELGAVVWTSSSVTHAGTWADHDDNDDDEDEEVDVEHEGVVVEGNRGEYGDDMRPSYRRREAGDITSYDVTGAGDVTSCVKDELISS